MKTELVDIEVLTSDPNNVRRHDAKNLAAIRGSIKQFGVVEPLVVRRQNNVVIGGNGRLDVLRELGHKQVPVHYVDLDDQKAKALALALNRSGELASWDMAALGKELQALYEDGFGIEDIGFDIEDLVDHGGGAGLTDEDDVPEVPQNVRGVKRGDIWQLGEHRLMCGDSKSKDDVERLMRGEKADMVFTDPPYGCDLGSTILGEDIKNDELSGDDLIKFFDKTFSCLPVKEWAVVYWFYSSNRVVETRQAASKFFKLKDTIIWVKDGFVPGRNDYQSQYESCLYLEKVGKGKVGRVWNGDRNKSNVWKFDRDRGVDHPTNKPVYLIEFAIHNSSNDASIVCDPFLGSGSTLIACEKTGRKCYGMEIDEHYCSVVIERWEKFSGKEAVRLGQG